jgi:cation/acetate symporter
MVNWVSITLFSAIILLSLVLTVFAAKRSQKADSFYTGGGQISPLQNALALVGDFVSASSFLGFVGLIALNGFDGVIYPLMGLMGWPLLLFLAAEILRKLGKYTFSDALAFRFNPVAVRSASSISSLLCTLFYLLAQMVGAGYLIQTIFGVPYMYAEILIGSVMVLYVLFGGMVATTWVQMTKAVLLIIGVIVLTLLILAKCQWSPFVFMEAVVEKMGPDVLMPGKLYANSWDLFSLGLAFMFGTPGLPHILMRFYTVPDAIAARKSAFYATGIIAFVYMMVFFLGFGAMIFVGKAAILAADKSGNMSALLLANVLGGEVMLGYIAAVAFATILAVVAGLALSGAATISHDLWAGVFFRGKTTEAQELKIAKISTLVIGVLAIGLGMIFEGQNVAILVGLAFSVAASSNFPALILSFFWSRATTQGIVACILVGAFSSVICILLSPTVMIDILHCEYCLISVKNPGIFTIPLSFLVGIVVSLVTRDPKASEAYKVLLDTIQTSDQKKMA